MSDNLEPLFSPFEYKSLKLQNRIVMAPMTRNQSPDGIPGQNVADYYQRRANGGFGLILSEGTVVNRPSARNHHAVPKFWGEDSLAGWKNVIEHVHAAGGKMGPQIWHVGAMPDPRFDWEPPAPPESPSKLHLPGQPERGVEMSDAAIADTIQAFADAARDAEKLGFDVFEIHGAHGYLIDEFFWDVTNKRSDGYGGKTLEERSRFAIEVVKAMRAAVSEDFPIIMRVSQWKQMAYTARLASTPEELERWLCPLKDAGVDIFHGSQRRLETPEFPEVDGKNGLNFAGWIKKVTGAPTISVGSVGLAKTTESRQSLGADPAPIDAVIERLEKEEFDLVAVARAALTDPEWANKIRDNRTDEMLGVTAESFMTLT
jgi:2,4-dienoyl-CoA reductase-like NADH-dependent reductase (Old Yellow Enzyme family)